MFAGKKSAQIREILISESAWEEMTCLFAPSKRIPVGKTKPAIYLSFDAAEVIEQVNKPDKCIDIKDEGYPHLGLWYLFDINDEFTLIEVTTTILELSSFFQRNEGGVVVPL